MNIRIRNELVIVQYENKCLILFNEFVDQNTQDRFKSRGWESAQQRTGFITDLWISIGKSSDQIAQKARWIVIPFIQRQPGDIWAMVLAFKYPTSDPINQQGCFSITGRCTDQCQLVCQPTH